VAIVTRREAEWYGGASFFEYDWDNVSLRITALRGRNCRAFGGPDGWTGTPPYDKTFGDTVETVAGPTGGANRLQLTVSPSGRLYGWDAQYQPIKPPGV
jgi:hypothetical protein